MKSLEQLEQAEKKLDHQRRKLTRLRKKLTGKEEQILTNQELTPDLAVDYIKSLTHSRGPLAGRPFELMPWQEDYIRRLFDPDRTIRRSLMSIPRKNGKSELAGALAVLFFDVVKPLNGQILLCGPTTKQAGELFRTVSAMLQKKYPDRFVGWHSLNRERKRYAFGKTAKYLEDHATGCLLQVLSADGAGHGYNPIIAICDELHEWEGKQANEFWTAMQTQFAAQPTGLLLGLSTVGHHDPTSIEQQEFEYAAAVHDGSVEDEDYLPLIYAAGTDDDWTDEDVWHRVNPALGHHKLLDVVRQECRMAQRQPSKINEFKRLHLNLRTAILTRWLDVDAWKTCQGTVQLQDSPGAGLDLSSTSDLTGFALVSKNSEDDFHGVAHAWIPAETAKLMEELHNVPYARWESEGWLTVQPGKSINQEEVIEYVIDQCKAHGVQKIAVDPWSVSAWIPRLEDAYLEVVKFQQGVAHYNEPCKKLDGLICDQQFTHDGNDLLYWCVSNADKRETHQGHVMPQKPKSYKKIDPLCALTMALSVVMASEPEPNFLVY